MTEYKICQCDINHYDGTAEFSVSIDVGYGPSTTRFHLGHTNFDIQLAGTKAMDRLCDACGISEPEDTSDFLGKTISMVAWEEVRRLAAEQYEMIWGRRTAPTGKKASTAKRLAAPKDDCRYVYIITCTDSVEPLCKIGIARQPESRLQQLHTASPHQLRIDAMFYSPRAAAVERAAHNHFADMRRNGEWFGMPASDAINFVHSQVLEGAA